MSKFKRAVSMRGCLIMTRKAGEQISINNGELLVEVVDVTNKFVKLAFKATKDISIRRAEKENDACNTESKAEHF